jgi:hypothetical protein
VLLLAGGLSGPATAVAQSRFTCADFTSQEAAQAILDADLDEGTNQALDPDGDGLACEDLPSSGNQAGPTAEPEETATPAETEEPAAKKPLEARFGGSRDSFETKYGEPVDAGQGNYPIGFYYEVTGFESVNVFYHKDYVAYLTLTAAEDAPWSKIKANQLVKGFLPADVKLDKPTTTDEDDALTTGHSKALEKRFGESTYDKYGAKGKLGDLYFLLQMNADNKVEVIEVGLGNDLQSGEEPTPTVQSGNYTPEQVAYLRTIRQEFDALQASLDTFDQVLDQVGNNTITADEAVNQLVTIFTTWQTANDTAHNMTPPVGMEETHELYLEFTGLLAGAAEDYANGLTNGDDAALSAGDDKVGQARVLRSLLDVLLTVPEE